MPRPGADELLVSEIFGPTIQGEGPSAGRSAAFLRLGMCNLQCTWCDTKYTWDAEQYDLNAELRRMPHPEVATAIDGIAVPLLVITGGEPALQAPGCVSLINALKIRKSVEIETSGTVWLGPLATEADQIVVSPKLCNSGVRTTTRLRMQVLQRLAELDHAVFKFVVRGPQDLSEVAELVESLDLDGSTVWIMPEATSSQVLHDRLARLVDPVAGLGWNLSGRLHIELWEDARGR